jgi:hypothetical protein
MMTERADPIRPSLSPQMDVDKAMINTEDSKLLDNLAELDGKDDPNIGELPQEVDDPFEKKDQD